MHYKKLREERISDYPRTIILGGIHGNEQGGIKGVQNFTSKIQSGSICSILANMPAIEEDRRFIHRNINRLFGRRNRFHKKDTYEFELVNELETLLKTSDFCLDLHNSNIPGSPVFLITEHPEVGKYFDVPYVLTGFDAIQSGGTDYYMNSYLGKIGLCLECGHISNTSQIWLQEQIINFLRFTGNVHQEPKKYTIQGYGRVTQCYRPHHTFRRIREFSDFEALKEGELIGYDGDEPIKANKNGFILFVNRKTNRKREAFVFGEWL